MDITARKIQRMRTHQMVSKKTRRMLLMKSKPTSLKLKRQPKKTRRQNQSK
jgi:hypothetical protein